MKKILILSMILLSGCNTGSITPILYEKAIELCKVNGGLRVISNPFSTEYIEYATNNTPISYFKHSGIVICNNEMHTEINFKEYE